MPVLLVAVYLIFIAPVQVGFLCRWQGSALSFHVGISVWGIRKIFHFPLQRDAQGKLYLETPLPLKKRRKPKRARKDSLSLFIRLLHMRKRMHAFIQLQLFKVQAFVHLPDAADTALACGILSSLCGILFPHGDSRFVPLWQGQNKGRGVCILKGRLGTIAIAYLIWKTHGKKEEQPWITPSPS